MAAAAKTRRVRVGHDFVPRSGEFYKGFRSEASFTMELTDDQLALLNEVRSKQIKFGRPGTPVLELIPEEGYLDAR